MQKANNLKSLAIFEQLYAFGFKLRQGTVLPGNH